MEVIKEELSQNELKKMPIIGFGTFTISGKECIDAVINAIKAGYRHIDTAQSYENEAEVGYAIAYCIAEGIVKREDLFITSKINPHKPRGYNEAIDAINSSLKKLGIDYIDMYLIHYPNNAPSAKWKKLNAETWRGFEYCYKLGLVKSLGVSNFNTHHLEELFKTAEILPVVNQLHLSPIWQQKPVVEFCQKHNIQCVAWSPLIRFIDRVSDILEQPVWESEDWTEPLMSNLEQKYKKSKAQIAIRWSIQKGYYPLVKSTKIERMRENLEVFDFQIAPEDMDKLDDLNARPTSPEAEFDSICTTWAMWQRITTSTFKNSIKIKFLNIPLIRWKRINPRISKIFLFNIIPFIKIKKKSEAKTTYYCCGIPIIKRKQDKYYLFGFIPFLQISAKYKTQEPDFKLVPDYRPKKEVYTKDKSKLSEKLNNKIISLKKYLTGQNLSKFYLFYLNLRRFITQKIYIGSLDVHLTTACTLRCKDCSHCIPYYKKENHHVMTLEEFQNELTIILKNVDRIYNLLLLGGEPLLNKDLSEIIKYTEGQKQVKNILIVTNGTLLPSDKVIDTCKSSKKTSFLISNYSNNKGLNNDKVLDLIQLLKTNDIKYTYESNAGDWRKQPEIKLENSNIAIEKIQDTYAKCSFKYCTLWSNGKIYPCAYAKYINDEKNGIYNNNFIDLRSGKLSPNDFKNFYDVSMYNVCECCDMAHYGEILLPAIQIDKEQK